MFKKSLLFMFVINALLGDEKKGAFFATGGYTPKIPYQVSTLDSTDSKDIQTEVHFGLALNFTPHFKNTQPSLKCS